ncbi:hypothetical protein CLM62_37105 [Streptomyces sp. SA15]|uniref:hypothetical protein n=1 Tax=Streptomyces sp. SA15 TaxID=934019 RepID=UPI000BAE71F0|nr:hypothetical protein [Streptomyces sp. SA15]PAZ11174.1 hypothetical protein CLM62_37105 [Streptomyces sp. SA15]
MATRSGTWPKTERVIQSALNQLTRQCMEERGFSYPAGSAEPPPDPADDAAVVELARRKEIGYGIASDPANANKPSSAVDRYYSTLPPKDQRRFDLALFGPDNRKATVEVPGRGRFRVPQEGCEADSRRRLAGDATLWVRIAYTPEAVDIQLSDRSLTAPAYRSALKRWRTCMSARGHAHAGPEAAYRSLQDEFRRTGGTPAFRKRETAVAVADGECALRTRLPSTALQARRDLTASVGEDVRRSLNELAAYRMAVVKRAEDMGTAG